MVRRSYSGFQSIPNGEYIFRTKKIPPELRWTFLSGVAGPPKDSHKKGSHEEVHPVLLYDGLQFQRSDAG